MRRYVHLRGDIVICILLGFVASLGTAWLARLVLPVLYEGYVEKNAIAENEVGGPAGEEVFRAQSVEDLLSHDVFTVVSPGIKYYNNGSAMYNGKTAEELMLPSGEFVMAVINRQSIQYTGEDAFSGDNILPVGRVVFEELEDSDNPDFLEQIQRRGPLARTDFYVDMSGTGGLIYEEEYNSRWIGVVQAVTIAVCFPVFHSIGSKLGLFPFFFTPKKREEAKSEWD